MSLLWSVPTITTFPQPMTITHETVAAVWCDALVRVYGSHRPLLFEQALQDVTFLDITLRAEALEAGFVAGTSRGDLYRVLLLYTMQGTLMHGCFPRQLSTIETRCGMPLYLHGFLDQQHVLPVFIARNCMIETVRI